MSLQIRSEECTSFKLSVKRHDKVYQGLLSEVTSLGPVGATSLTEGTGSGTVLQLSSEGPLHRASTDTLLPP